ncbi:MAG: hypothetical protein CVV64_10625 [Candidatus Wallbacteria bacterium HGW-Wallbacteria-1]|uniref:Uncharacterized protein n=1 Tax=Candidatus Wallbacteria bacterium HGW-Wallbacteria-1 TaxID=2013854 RepID=A0A2N1PPB5_9BACT|nr:MAG: hypothetical protein CVV64_10625 [Candidatus Wallbacteria bacterium HGW-Wallbacteria-1]
MAFPVKLNLLLTGNTVRQANMAEIRIQIGPLVLIGKSAFAEKYKYGICELTDSRVRRCSAIMWI